MPIVQRSSAHLRVGERQRFLGLSKCPIVRRLDDAAPRRYGRIAAAVASRSIGRADASAAESGRPARFCVLLNELAHLFDGDEAAE